MMALTGMPDGPPVVSPAPAFAMLGQVTAELARVTAKTGTTVDADPAELIAGRAAFGGFTRGGRVSAGGASFLLRAADGWCAVTLSRPDDVAAVPAIVGVLGLDGAVPDAIVTRADARAAQLAGVPAAALPSAPVPSPAGAGPSTEAAGWPPWRAARIAAPLPGAGLSDITRLCRGRAPPAGPGGHLESG